VRSTQADNEAFTQAIDKTLAEIKDYAEGLDPVFQRV